MSRSIGDLIATTLGVIPEPKFIEEKVDKDTKFMVIASDDDTRINLKYKGHSEKDKNVNIMVYNVNDELKVKMEKYS